MGAKVSYDEYYVLINVQVSVKKTLFDMTSLMSESHDNNLGNTK